MLGNGLIGRHRRLRRAFSIMELFVIVLACGVVFALLMPAFARIRGESAVQASFQNLQRLHQAMTAYGADWNDRQPTWIVDDFSTYGNDLASAFTGYISKHQQQHPTFWLGAECDGGTWFLGQPSSYYIPISFANTGGLGSFRMLNARIVHDYVDGRTYGPTFFAPNDRATYAVVDPWLEYRCEWLHPSTMGLSWVLFSSYTQSPAAMYDPGVLRRPSQGGYQNPFSLSTGFASPTFSQALYPKLKTLIIEHHWNQNPPADICQPDLSNTVGFGCQPYYFNLGLASAPATLFYDGSIRLLPNSEVIDADARVLAQTGGVDGLWSRDTPWGPKGYFGDLSYDGTIASHHVLTTDGIRGRDTLGAVKPTNPPKD